MIKTKRVKLTPKDLFITLILSHIKKRWWLFAWIFILAIIVGLDGISDSFEAFFILLANKLSSFANNAVLEICYV